MEPNRNSRIATLAAILGGSAVVAMGIIAATIGAGPGNSPTVASGPMTVGETTTVTYTGTIAPVVAVPPVKAKPYGG